MVSQSLHFGVMAMGLLGGLAVFLFGLEQMTAGLKAAAGSHRNRPGRSGQARL